MNSRFDRSSNNSSGSNRAGIRRTKGKVPISDKSIRRKESFDSRGPYRTNSDKRTTDGQMRRQVSRNGSFRRSRSNQEARYGQENDKDIAGSRPFPRKPNRQRQSTRGLEQRTQRSSSWNRDSRARRDHIDSSLPEGQVFSSLHEGESSDQLFGTDMLWGRHSTQSALESGRPVHRIWCTPELRSSQRFLQLLRDAKSSGVLVEEVTWARLGQLTNGAVHQGIAIQTAAAETLHLQTLIDGCNELSESPILLALDGLTDPQNLGAIVRSAEAFGAHGLVLPQRRSAGLTGSVAKVAAGALEHLPVAKVVNLNRSLEELKSAGYRVIGLAEEGSETLPEVDLQGPLVVVAGSEGKGISLVTRRHCDHLVRIPLRGVTPSLNASVATAVFLYEVARSGWMKGLTGQDPSPRMVRAKCASASIENEELSLSKEDKLEKKDEVVEIARQVVPQPVLNNPTKENLLNLEGDTDLGSFKQSIHL